MENQENNGNMMQPTPDLSPDEVQQFIDRRLTYFLDREKREGRTSVTYHTSTERISRWKRFVAAIFGNDAKK